MYQCEVTRFARSRNNDLALTFVPILFAFGLRGVLSSADIPQTLFMIIQILLVAFVVAAFVLSYWFYFRYFRYTVVDKGEGKKGNSFPAGSLTFERLINKKARIYERVMAKEMLCLLAPGEDYDAARFGAPAKTYNLTAKAVSTAYRLYYRQEKTVYCALFHPDAEQIQVLRSWIEEN